MTEVPTQTDPQTPTATVSMPGPTPPAVPATPAGNNAPANPPNTPPASTETQPGTGWGVDQTKDMTAEDLGRQIEMLDDDVYTQDEAPPAVPAAAADAPPAAAAPTPPPVAAPAADEGEGLLLPGELPGHYKVPTGGNPLTFHTLRLHKQSSLAGGNMTLGQAEAMAAQLLGLPQPGQPAAAVPAAATPPGTAPTPEAPPEGTLEDRVNQAYAEYQAAGDNFDPPAQAAALRQIHTLEREVTLQAQTRAVADEQQRVSAEAEFINAFNSSNATATSLYPDAGIPNSTLALRAAQIQEAYGNSQDPAQHAIYQSPTSPLFFFQMAAAELGVAPSAASPLPPVAAAPGAPPLVRTSTPQPVPGHRPPVQALLASSPGTNTPPAAQSPILNITNAHDLEAIIGHLPDN